MNSVKNDTDNFVLQEHVTTILNLLSCTFYIFPKINENIVISDHRIYIQSAE